MNVSRFIHLAELGFNVPRFVLNPVTNYGRDAYASMKDYFQCTVPFDMLATRKDGHVTRMFEKLLLGDAVLRLSHLEASSYETVLMEHVEFEWEGIIMLLGGEYGRMRVRHVDAVKDEKFHFGFLQEVQNLVHRHVVRECLKFPGVDSSRKVRMDVRWATEFRGVNSSKLVFLDYKYL